MDKQISEADEPVIQVEQLVKTYGSLKAVQGVTFNVMQGEIFGLLGPNGAGKTTTMEMMEGLRKPTSGSARIAGYDTQKQLKQVKSIIGVQLQSTSMFDLLTVAEMAKMYGSFYSSSLPLEPLLESVDLTGKASARVKSLSGGQKQRLAIALALVNDPLVVFLDEPTTGLDPQARRSLWDIVLKLKEQGKTVVLSTHYMDEAHILCDRICLIDQGKVIALDTPERLIEQLDSHNAVEFLLAIDQRADADLEAMKREWEQLAQVEQVVVHNEQMVLYTADIQQTLKALLHWSDENEVELSQLRTRTATLEDVFIHMTGRSLREE